MNKEILLFGNIWIDKRKFHYLKNQIWMNDVDTDKILISNEVSFGESVYKHFICYEDNDKVIQLSERFQKLIQISMVAECLKMVSVVIVCK